MPLNIENVKLVPKANSLAAKLTQAKAASAKSDSLTTKEPEFKWAAASAAIDRIGIIFDDSGSMGGKLIKDAIEGTIEFMRNCVPNQTAIGIFRMNDRKSVIPDLPYTPTAYTTDLPRLSLEVKTYKANGESTPMFETCRRAFNANVSATRLIIFSDGLANSSTTGYDKEEVIEEALSKKIKIDTCYFGSKVSYYDPTQEDSGYKLLKEIAERTGGICLCFDADKVDFKKAFKYLTPNKRLMLTQGNNIAKLEAGELV